MGKTLQAEKLKLLRLRSGYSNNDVIKLLGVNWSVLSLYEYKTNPKMQFAVKLAAIYGVSLDYLLFGEYKTGDELKDPRLYQLLGNGIMNISDDDFGKLLKLIEILDKKGSKDNKKTEFDISAVAGRLKKVRKERGIRLVQISKKLNIKPYHYKKYEAGKVAPRIKTLKKILKLYKIPADYIMLGKPPLKEELSKIRIKEITGAGIRKLPREKKNMVVEVLKKII